MQRLNAAIVHAAMVGAGGFLGALCRFAMSSIVQRQFPASAFPYGTLAVNLLGCLLIGIAVGYAESRQIFSAEYRHFILIGILGGFTTYSTFSYETLALLQDADYLGAVLNIAIHVVLGLLLVWLGLFLMTREL